MPWLHVAFENAAAAASGVESAYRALRRRGGLPQEDELTIVAFAGDGGTYDIGLQALSGALERGHRFVFVCYDNQAYMNTGIQRSGATPLGAATTTTPAGTASLGKLQQRKDMTAIAVAHRIPYVAQSAAGPHWQDLSAKAARAAKADGPAFLNVLADCPLGWGHEPSLSPSIVNGAVESCVWPLYEVDDGQYRLTYRPADPIPVVDWLRTQKRFAHLFRPEAARRCSRRSSGGSTTTGKPCSRAARRPRASRPDRRRGGPRLPRLQRRLPRRPEHQVVAFTATQIPDIDERRYPASLAGPLYPDGIPIAAEAELSDLFGAEGVDEVVLRLLRSRHEQVMHLASRCSLPAPTSGSTARDRTMLRSTKPVVAVSAVRTGAARARPPVTCRDHARRRAAGRLVRHPMPYGDLDGGVPAVRVRRPRPAPYTSRSARSTSRTSTAGMVVYAGVDYDRILREAEPEADVDPVGRRQQRPAVLRARPAHRRRRPAAPGRRAATTPGRRTSAWPMSSSSTRATRREAADIEARARRRRAAQPHRDRPAR